jgi:hypothetical protein
VRLLQLLPNTVQLLEQQQLELESKRLRDRVAAAALFTSTRTLDGAVRMKYHTR